MSFSSTPIPEMPVATKGTIEESASIYGFDAQKNRLTAALPRRKPPANNFPG